MKKMIIDNIQIGRDFRPYIIAEMSANHNGDIENAFKIIEMSKRCGAQAVKMQTYTPDTITINSDKDDFKITKGLWKGNTLYDLYKSAYTPWEWHEALFKKAKELDITMFSSPFDFTAVDLLEELNAPAYKIASFETVDLPLIKYVAQTSKPMIISTGMASIVEIEEAIETAYANGCSELAILRCVSGYPAPSKDYNLKTLLDMQDRFNVLTGLSDHTLNNVTAIASIALGASIIEKHVTLDRNGGGPDDSFSLEEKDLKELCDSALTCWESLGSVNYDRKDSEKENVQFRRSLYFVKDMKAGDVITDDCIRSVRPGFGLAPKFYDAILGKTVVKDVEKNTATGFDLFK